MNITSYNICQCHTKAAGEKHRLPYSAKAQRELTAFINAEIIKTEKKVLKLFGLPTIQEIELFNTGRIDEKPGGVEVTEAKRQQLYDYVSELQVQIVGDYRMKKIFDANNSGTLGPSLFSVFKGHLGYVFDMLKRLFLGDKDKFDNLKHDPIYNDDLFQSVLGTGVDRIKTKLYLDNYSDCIDEILRGVMNNQSPLRIAANLHNRFGGAFWQWETIVTSEITLVMNASFKIQARRAGVNYEVWSAAAGACAICAALDKKMWKINEGPEPVSSTHPRCACYKFGIFLPGETPIQDRWSRRSPYGSGNGWTREEIEALPGSFL